MAAIELIDLTKHYKQGKNVVKALDGVSLSIQSGEFVAVVGRSGSGKTTMLDLLGLLLRPTAGRILIDGVDTGTLKDSARATMRGERIGFIFQEFNLLPTLNAIENVMLPLRYRRGRDPEGRARALRLLQEVDLADRVDHKPAELSGGQAQRVAIARSLINNPALVLGDEPTGEVDSETSTQLIDLMRRMNRERGVTFVIVTHDMEIAHRTDRIIRLKDGKVLSDDRITATNGSVQGTPVPA
ncbi:MAG: ABC transporter ATP-binding protein [Candidatus Dormibacteraeota bacterium]|nr:ABC transporter ATP-binding protein [Candidatus Dormibacteraeota bacterium]